MAALVQLVLLPPMNVRVSHKFLNEEKEKKTREEVGSRMEKQP